MAQSTGARYFPALRDACGELGLQLAENTNARGFAKAHTPGQFVVRLNGPYDIALNRETEEEPYTLTADWWDGHVEREVGENYGRLLQAYGVHKATREAQKRGHTVRRRRLEDGTVKLSIGGVS